MSTEAAASLYTAQTVMGVSIAASVGSAVMALSSPQGAFSIINQFQMTLLIPMIDDYLPADVEKFILGMSFTLFSLDFIPIENIPIVAEIREALDYDQDNSYMKDLGMKSGSAFINQLKLLFVLTLLS